MALIWRQKPSTTGPDTTVEPLVVSSVSALTAASTAVPAHRWGKVVKPSGEGKKWQPEAWDMLDNVGELSFALLWKTALLSRFRLVASDIDPETGKPTGSTENAAAKAIVAQIAGGVAGQSQMLGRLAPLMMIPGEGWLAIIYPDGQEQWHVLSTDEIKTRGDDVEITLQDGTTYKLDKAVDTLSRIWRQDPRQSWLAWSPVKAALPILRRIVRMEQNIEAAGKSRQAGNGILVLPREISMPTAPAPRGEPDPDAPNLPPPPAPPSRFASADEIRIALQEAMSKAIDDPSSAAALVPIVLTVAGDYVDKIRHIKFDSEVSEKAQAAQEKAVRRLAMTLDMPPEVLLGLADLNHWSLYGVEEEAVRWHAAPEMETICAALTEQLLRPMLGAGAENVVIWYDTSDVEAEPDQLAKVSAAYKDGVVNAEAYIRELGLSVEEDGYDLTTETGWALWAVDQVRRTPQLLPQLLPVLRMLVPALSGLPELPAAPANPSADPPPETIDARVPDTRENAAAQAIVRMCVNEAMRLAANRRRTRGAHPTVRGMSTMDTHRQLGPCAESEVARLIAGWDDMVDEGVCATAGIDRERLRGLVVATCRAALTTGQPPALPAQLTVGALV